MTILIDALKTVKLPTASALGKTFCTSTKFDHLALLETLFPASPGVPNKVFMAVPTVEAILEQDQTDSENERAYPPITRVLKSLNAGQIQILQQQLLIQLFTQFLANVLSQAA